MSLLNQVLRNLDQRQVHTTPAAQPLAPLQPPKAIKAPMRPAASSQAKRAQRWALGAAATASAIVAGGWTQGSLSWPMKAPAASIATTTAPDPATATATATATEPTPLPRVAPAPVVAAATPILPAPPAPAPEPAAGPPSPAPVQIALAAPTARPSPSLARREPAAKAGKPATEAAHPQADARIDKRATGRTAQERAEAHYQRGVAAHQAGQFGDSAEAFAAALREEPRFAPARLAQAGVLIAVARHDDAYTLLQDGLALSPRQPALSLMLARLQAERQQLDQAAATLQAALPAAAGNAEYLGTYAAILQRANRHAEASQHYSAALRIAPGHAVWWMGLGMSLAMTDQREAAREAFTRAKAIGLPPEAAQYVDARLRQLG